MRVRLPFPKVPRTAAANDECTDNAYKLAIEYKIKRRGAPMHSLMRNWPSGKE